MLNILNHNVKIYRDKNGIYIGHVPSLQSCYTQAENLKDLKIRIKEVIHLSLEIKKSVDRTKEFIGKKIKSYAKVGSDFTSQIN